MVETDPITAKYLIDNIVYGVCKYCNQSYAIRKDGKVRKHNRCPVDYASHRFINGEPIRLDELAEIAMAG